MTRSLRPVRARFAILASSAVCCAALTAAQTPVQPPNNSYTPEQDVELGRQAAAEVRQQLPLLDDERTEAFADRLGSRLTEHVPRELQQPAFRYSFDVVNLKEINAFALPGGPMFLHRGMIEAAKTEGEVVGVMAHELSHVVLRHGTAQATKGQKFQLGALAGQVLGAIVGGRTGSIIAQGSQFGLGTYLLKYSREYERDADLLGAQIMARAGYDPREMANMFRTIEKQGGNRGPEWLSSHPNPGNRYETINREAAALQVDGSAGSPADFQAVKARLAQMKPAPTSQEAQRASASRGGGARAPSGPRPERVEPPSARYRTYQPSNFLRVSVPENWSEIGNGSTVRYAPEGGFWQTENGRSSFSHGVEVGVFDSDGSNLQEATEQLLRGFAQSNPQLRRQGGYSRTNVGGRQGLTIRLTNVTESGDSEMVSVSTAQLRDRNVLFLIGVAPQAEASLYRNTFSRVRDSLQIQDDTLRE